MRRGTTPTITLNIPFEASDISVAWITFAQGGSNPATEILTKTLTDDGVTLEDGKIIVEFSQEDTLAFAKTGLPKVQVQVRILFADGSADASNIVDMAVGPILKDGVIG